MTTESEPVGKVTKLIVEKLQVEQLIKDTEEKHKQLMEGLESTLAHIKRQIELIGSGIDRDAVTLAETLIVVRGSLEHSGQDGPHMLREAIADVADYCPRLQKEYLGTKDYDRWHGQGISGPYGYGPKHGTVIFSIGLSQSLRNRLRDGGFIHPQEREAMLYYLVCLKQIQDASKKAANPK